MKESDLFKKVIDENIVNKPLGLNTRKNTGGGANAG